ncbi:MAG: helix-turn-helix domain-containing protein [Nocardioides sp.]
MTGEGRSWTEILARARQRLLGGEDTAEPLPASGVREEIVASWRRSYDEGALTSGLSTPYDDNINLASRLVRAAEPVIGRVQEDVLGSPITVVLADSRGKVLIRRSGEPNLESRLDNALLAPGFNYAERYVGTNGIGTALEGKATQSVVGFEHFNESLQAFACYGVPLRDPVTRRQLGVLDITTWADRAHPALSALARQAASVIEEGLMQMSSRGAQELLHEYLVASRNREDQVLAISGEAFIGSGSAHRRLGGLGREEMWPMVENALISREEADLPLLTGGLGVVPLKLRAVRSSRGELSGAVIIIRHSEAGARPKSEGPPDTRELSPVAFQGLSPVTVGPTVMVRRLAAGRLPVCLIGEPGTGKRFLVEAIAAESFPGRTLLTWDATQPDRASVAELLDEWRGGRPGLLRAVDALDPADLETLMVAVQEEAARASGSCGWLALTLQSRHPAATSPLGGSALTPPDDVQTTLASAGIPIVVLPPLRSRVQDLHQILPIMLRRLSGDRIRAVTPALMNKLVREPWPGNFTEVVEVMTLAVGNVKGTRDTLDVSDLPAGFGSGVRRKLSPLEWMAREAIVEALRATRGDKQLAADALGISRASIYRKIKTYDIDTGEF